MLHYNACIIFWEGFGFCFLNNDSFYLFNNNLSFILLLFLKQTQKQNNNTMNKYQLLIHTILVKKYNQEQLRVAWSCLFVLLIKIYLLNLKYVEIQKEY